MDTDRIIRGKYNYLVLFFRFLILIGSCIYLYVLLEIIPDYWQENRNYLVKAIGILAGFLLAYILINRMIRFLNYQRYNFFLYNDRITMKNVISGKETDILIQEIKGYSLSNYPTKIRDFKEIIIYLKNGKKIELPQFLFFNFKDLMQSLNMSDINFLGHENFKWKFLDSRVYQYED